MHNCIPHQLNLIYLIVIRSTETDTKAVWALNRPLWLLRLTETLSQIFPFLPNEKQPNTSRRWTSPKCGRNAEETNASGRCVECAAVQRKYAIYIFHAIASTYCHIFITIIRLKVNRFCRRYYTALSSHHFAHAAVICECVRSTWDKRPANTWTRWRCNAIDIECRLDDVPRTDHNNQPG